MTIGRDLCKAGGNESTFHKQVVILDMSFQQVLKTGQACFTHTHISVPVANAQHLSQKPPILTS